MADPQGELHQRYLETQVQTASPEQLILMLYDGALRFMSTGREAIEKKDIAAQTRFLLRAQKIVAELQSSLDRTKGGEIAENLNALYTYAYKRLVEANLESDPAKVDESHKIVSGLREAWVIAMQKKTITLAAPPRAREALPLPIGNGTSRLDISG